MAGPTAHIGHAPGSARLVREAVEQLPIERLAGELVEDPPCILVGDLVVASPDVLARAHPCRHLPTSLRWFSLSRVRKSRQKSKSGRSRPR
jgi:hypothetical protein